MRLESRGGWCDDRPRHGLLRFVNRSCSVSQSGRQRRWNYVQSLSGTMLFGVTETYYSLSGHADVWSRLHMLYRKNRGWEKQVCRVSD